MPRRADHSREELAALVFEAARSIAAAEGAAAVTMRGIAARIGYAPGSIYNAVGDIDAVMLRVHADTLGRLAARLEPIAQPAVEAGAAIGTMVRLARAYVGFVAENAALWAALIERAPPPGGGLPEWYSGLRPKLLELVSEVLAASYPDERLRRRAVVALWAALQGVASLAAGGNLAFAAPDAEPGDIAESIVRRYLTGHEPGGAAGQGVG